MSFDWSGDGKRLLISQGNGATGHPDLWLLPEDDAQGLVQRDIAFHDLLYQLADHDLLIRAWQENIAGKLRILLNVSQRTLSALADAERQHRRLLEPILEGDDARARRLLEEHIDEAAARARQGLWGSQDGAQSTVEGSQP